VIYLHLFLSYLKIGFFGFGGGYAMLSLVSSEVVARRGWLDGETFADIVALSQMTPGPIGINSATYVGYTVTGSVWGAMVATVAVCLPALTVMILVAKFYARVRDNRYVSGAVWGMQPVIVGMVAAAALLLATPAAFGHWTSWAIFGAVLLAAAARVSPILLLVASGVAGYFLYNG
jgi:chromate transporter